MLQFSINTFTLAFARTVLFDSMFHKECKERVCNIILERDRVRSYLNEAYLQMLYAYPSEGNFLLIRFKDDRAFHHVLRNLSQSGVKVFDTSGFPLLERTFRVSIGSEEENEQFLACFEPAL